ncbi:MAG: tRNA lysidine(34) synthetase TilS [Chitinispirillia bacterium]|nr:tRNA lysidine(34) synthetase TilS [Chitinispirillia bacterium]MCL2268107.1 tRNA lysidine(34) synthetase TilS [Chitinispirillia bacterium]
MLSDELAAFFAALPGGPRAVLAGVSGGADSVALIHLLHQYKAVLGISRLAAAHVNHGLRGNESDGDEAFVRETAKHLGVELFCTSLDGTSAADNRDGIEEWARRHRYEFFTNTAKSANFNYIATAHTANDQAETLILRMARGTGVRGLRGILPVRADGVIRPLLRVERHELTEWLAGRGLTWREDSSNADTKFRRNYVRANIMPVMDGVNPSAVMNIAACAESAARAWEIVGEHIDAWAAKYVLRVNSGVFHVEKAGLAQDSATAREALLALFDEYGITASRRHIERITAAAGISHGEHLLPDGWKFYPRDDRICFVREPR